MAREVMVPTPRRPSTPGGFIRDYIEDAELNLTQGMLADRLGVSRANLNAIINGKRAITLGMAMRLERVLGVSVQTWLNLQAAVDIYDALHSLEAKESLRKAARSSVVNSIEGAIRLMHHDSISTLTYAIRY